MKISQEAREAANRLGLYGPKYERAMQSLINSTLERAAGVFALGIVILVRTL